ncbi:uncharacterized protein LOC111386195 [Olea europaea var. sylvestris]|uniref:uncharacterized protein LOC111386195 n=1 Tax=Olea europaea var. sylvestris TaxID=158386 RepID=UPI000C1D04C5|nr:uncharacterized protein LOC111386195 [Olea europaea var. sylvestris]
MRLDFHDFHCEYVGSYRKENIFYQERVVLENLSTCFARKVLISDDDCKWMLRASSVKQSAIFMIRKFNNVHTCSIDYRRNAHRHATSSVIAEQIMGKLDNTYGSYDPTAIARDMEREFDVKISYHQACRENVAALHMLHGTSGDSFQKLSSYCHVLGESKPGTVTHIEVDSHNRFHYIFLAFGASIRGYVHYLRLVICVDDSHLKCPYKGNLLLATVQDANKQIYPLAWEIVVGAETNRSWMWFLSNLKDLIGDSEELVRAIRTYRTEESERLMGQLRRKWFYERQASATACSTVLSPAMENELQTTFEAGTGYERMA